MNDHLSRSEDDRLQAEADAYQAQANAERDQSEIDRLRRINAGLLAACRYALSYTVANGDAHDRIRAAVAKAEGGAA